MSKSNQTTVVLEELTGAVETTPKPKALRYVDPNFQVPGVPARDLTAEEVLRFGARIREVEANSGLKIYEEVA